MRQRSGIGISVLSFVCLVALAPASVFAQQRNLSVTQLQIPGERPVALYANSYALIIGASAYSNGWPRLGAVPSDVRAVSAALRDQGFSVTEVLNPTLAQLEGALRKFIEEYGQSVNNRVIIYFAGHGHTLKSAAGADLGYIVPVDAPVPDERNPRSIGAFKSRAMSMESIENFAKQIDAKHALFLFDSCFSGTFFKMRAVPEVISMKTAQPVRQFITAGSADQQVPDVSVFRQQFIRGIRGEADRNSDGYVTGSELGSFLEDTVTNYSRQTQTPQYGKIRDPNLDKGDFVFALPGRRSAPAAPSTAAVDAVAVEVNFWDSVKDSRSPDELNAYLESYPDGRFASLARARIRSLNGAATAPTQIALNAPAVTGARPAAVTQGSLASMGRGTVFRDCDDCPEMVVIPAGSFIMGSPASETGRLDTEGPQHQINIARPFAAGKYEVTFDEWDACVRERGCSYNPSDSGWGRGKRPVINVSYQDAKAYTEWLSRKSGKSYRLLTEAEWEYVARAGTSTAFSFGASITPQQANYATTVSYAGSPVATTPRNTVPVGSYAPNAFGLYDVHGNVWEWTEDCWNGSYSGAPSDGSAWASGDCSRRVLRGGSWFDYPQLLRSAIRYWLTSSDRNYNFGFRVSRTD